MKLWIDDERPPPDDTWHWVKNSADAYSAWNTMYVTEMSFDHDLGAGGDTRQVALAILGMAQAGQHQPPRWYVHSANPVGKDWLVGVLLRADHYWRSHQTEKHLAASYKRKQ